MQTRRTLTISCFKLYVSIKNNYFDCEIKKKKNIWIFSSLDARHAIEKLRHQKSLLETIEEESETRSSDDSILKDSSNSNGFTEETMTCNQKTFQVGEFVYVDAKKEVKMLRLI